MVKVVNGCNRIMGQKVARKWRPCLKQTKFGQASTKRIHEEGREVCWEKTGTTFSLDVSQGRSADQRARKEVIDCYATEI
jgi:hypothetical protein